MRGKNGRFVSNKQEYENEDYEERKEKRAANINGDLFFSYLESLGNLIIRFLMRSLIYFLLTVLGVFILEKIGFIEMLKLVFKVIKDIFSLLNEVKTEFTGKTSGSNDSKANGGYFS